MYYELYMDLLFLVNFLMDYILLLIVKFILKTKISYGRICLGALLGSVLSCMIVAINISVAPLKIILFYVVIPSFMLLVIIPTRDVRVLIRGLITLYISGFLIGGIFEAFAQYVPVGGLFFALAIASYYIASAVLKILMLLLHFGEVHCEVILCTGQKMCTGRAIADTGNHLRDDVSGKPVSIVTGRMAKQLFGENGPDSVRYIPYRTIGNDGGVIPVVKIDSILVKGKAERYFEDPLIAISEESSFANECDVILNPDL
ncbi:MAG: sigma-E processing peptidase SpoIIGA [Eubacteriales bacterium]|nr:sigma-E processing peptidase SpoIIGA [Eubacteriales bacterium]